MTQNLWEADQHLPWLRRSVLLSLVGMAAWPLARPAEPVAPALMLANVYHPGIDLAAYWLSEKYDGVRGYWDGKRLFTRGGEQVHPPAWFTAGWPAEPMDGELWAGRGRFEFTVSTVRKQEPEDQAWRQVHFMVFDLPAHPGVFSDRISAYTQLLKALNRPWVQPVRQEPINSHAQLMQRLDQLVRAGGEGLMLHRGEALYRAQRSDDLLKVKTHDDAEARVIAHVKGQGKYAGVLGALQVRTADGLHFRIGSGLSDAQRRDPPPVGSWITYRYRGLHGSGLPRFATFVRVRADMEPNTPVRP